MPEAVREDLPATIPLECPLCDGETDHAVLKGTVGLRGDYTLDAVVRCEQCATTRHVVHREPGEREVPVILSSGAESRRTRMLLGEDEEIAVGDEILVDDIRSVVTGLEDRKGLRVDAGTVPEIGTLWAKEFERLQVGFTINMGKKTIAKDLEMAPEDVLHVGEEKVFGKLRVTIHGIKTSRRMVRKGEVEAKKIRRVFAKPTPDHRTYTRPRRTMAKEDRARNPRPEGPRGRGRSPGRT